MMERQDGIKPSARRRGPSHHEPPSFLLLLRTPAGCMPRAAGAMPSATAHNTLLWSVRAKVCPAVFCLR